MEVQMTKRTLSWVAEVLTKNDSCELVEKELCDREDNTWSGAVVDSRADCSGRVFFAIAGENTDGHRYVNNAFESGAIAAVVDDVSVCARLRQREIPYLCVSNSVKALQALAREYRGMLEARVVAITGSAGKTTTKEYIRQVVRSKYRVSASPGNFNSLIGVPLTVLETDSDSEYLICEVGANQTGEIDFLAGLLRPDIGVITNVGDAHVGMFGSVDAIADAKSELLAHVAPQGSVVLPADDPYFDLFKGRSMAKVVSFGRSRQADYELSNVETAGARLSFDVNDIGLSINALGEYNALNACAAVAVGEICGVESSSIVDALADVSPMQGRGKIHNSGGVFIVDESYNASPASMNLSLKTLEGLAASRRLVVLGDMKELGHLSGALHRRLGERLATSDIDAVFWFGEEGLNVRDGFSVAGGTGSFRLYESLDTLTRDFIAGIHSGDAVLIKASRAQNLDRVVARLLVKLDPETEN
jgi:UDP-N-acetylmuramoyl-tripeptide--D-alanyl-D-alanine ligase